MTTSNLDKALNDAKEKAAAARARVRELNRKKREAEKKKFEREALAIGRRVLIAAKEGSNELFAELSVLSDELAEKPEAPAEDAGTGAQHPVETGDADNVSDNVSDTPNHAMHDAQAEYVTGRQDGDYYA